VDFVAVVDQAIALLRQRGRLTYRTLQLQFQLDADHLEALKDELIEGQRLAVDEAGRVLVWSGASGATASPAAASFVEPPPQAPLAYTPPYLAEKILTSRSALEGERKQVTVLFADLKGSMELLADRDPEEARQLLDPVLERMMHAVHRYEGTVNQVMGDGIMALFGAPLAHEDHAVRACYAALAMQAAVKQYAAEMQRRHGVPVQIPRRAQCWGSGRARHWQRSPYGLHGGGPDHPPRRPHGTDGPAGFHSADAGRAESGGGLRAGHATGTRADQGFSSTCRRL
jgi:class 3 adenylate cyclase